MPIQFACPGCGATLRVADSAAGREMQCPKCQASATVPEGEGAVNPYASPAGDSSLAAPAETAYLGILQAELGATRPWAVFLGILAWFMTALLLLGTFAVPAAGIINDEPVYSYVGAFFFYAVSAVFYAAFAWLIFRYGSSIGRFQNDASPQSLKFALAAQKNFWRLFGIFAILWIVLLAVAICIGVFVAMSATL